MSEASLGHCIEDMFLGNMFSLLPPPERLGTREYAETYRWLDSEVSAFPGQMDCMKTPFMLFPMQCMDDINIKIIVARKSAQISWSETQNSFISKHMDIDPQNIIMAFPRAGSVKSYANEKIRPMIKGNPRLLATVGDPEKCSFDFYKFKGGFLKMVTAGSVAALKSTSAPILIVEEPDDLKEDLKGQGDALEIFTERQKTYEERKLIFGGTPSEVGFSKVDQAFDQSNKMFYNVPCRKCGQFHILDFDNLKYDKYFDGSIHKSYGLYNPATAYYSCPHCSVEWDDKDKEKSIIEALNFHEQGWQATAESKVYGFAFNELLSSFPGSSLVALAEKRLKAETEADKGKDGKLKSFTNNSMGLAYSPKTVNLTVDALKSKRLDYPEMVVHPNGIVLTMGIDVQHNRFAVIIRAWGRNGNSWLVYWGEIFGYVKDPDDSCWAALTELALGKIPHALSTDENPVNLTISALSIDSSDGNTTQLVYNWVKQVTKVNKYIYATKGDSELGSSKKEIFKVPSNPDNKTMSSARKTIAETSGIHVYMVGTQLGKDEVLRKLTLNGNRDRSYHYATCREDYEEQILSNKKRISAISSRVRYELAFGQSDEVLDCEVLALHASRALHLHLWSEKYWSQVERSITGQFIKNTAKESNVTAGIN